jgi:hypothetical protein
VLKILPRFNQAGLEYPRLFARGRIDRAMLARLPSTLRLTINQAMEFHRSAAVVQ